MEMFNTAPRAALFAFFTYEIATAVSCVNNNGSAGQTSIALAISACKFAAAQHLVQGAHAV